jgi:hypothetical protein
MLPLWPLLVAGRAGDFSRGFVFEGSPRASGRYARKVGRQTQTAAPAAITFLQRLIDASNALRFHRGDCRRPHRLNNHLARSHQVDAFVKGFPKGAELASLFRLGKDRDGLVDFIVVILPLSAYLISPMASQTIAISMIPIDEISRIEALPLNSGFSNSAQLSIGRPIRSGRMPSVSAL